MEIITTVTLNTSDSNFYNLHAVGKMGNFSFPFAKCQVVLSACRQFDVTGTQSEIKNTTNILMILDIVSVTNQKNEGNPLYIFISGLKIYQGLRGLFCFSQLDMSTF